MRSLDVVVAHSDHDVAEIMALLLGRHFRSVSVATSADELRSSIAHRHLSVAVVDYDLMTMRDMQLLRTEFGVRVVCTHRVPDERMWADALGHGALDCCEISDITGIVDAVRRDLSRRSQVA